MAEGLSAAEVGKEIAEHRERSHAPAREETARDRVVTIIEASLLAAVALLAAWSGYASAKWGTEFRLLLGEASTARIEANQAAASDAETLTFDSSTFDTWFTAFVSDNQEAMDVAQRRFRPEFQEAFDAWMATDPFTSGDAPPGPTYMPEYARPQLERAEDLEAESEARFAEGAEAAETADQYVRITVFLATVLFLVGISGHFRVRAARYGLVAVGAIILIFAVALLVASPRPPV
ncbi:MAG: hypothetical protein ABWZ30_01500 [Jiangellaceae bacterium]